MRLEKFEQLKAREQLSKSQQADFLAPYLVRHTGVPQKAEATRAFKDCLDDLRKHHAELYEELKTRLDELAGEEQTLRKFLMKFQEQLDDDEYEKFMVDGDNIEKHKNVIQMRIASVLEEYERKFENLKLTLQDDPRLQNCRDLDVKFDEMKIV